jgi:hypothetical protein
VALLVALFFVISSAALLMMRGPTPEPEILRYVPSSERALLQFCGATQSMLRARPPPKEVAFDLSRVSRLERLTVGVLEYACNTWSAAGIPVTIDSCPLDAAAALWRRGVRAEVRCDGPSPSTVLH